MTDIPPSRKPVFSIDGNNYWFTILVPIAFAIGGSFGSILVSGAGAWALLRLAIGSFPFTKSPVIRWMMLAAIAYYLSGVAIYFQNMDDPLSRALLWERLPFLFIPAIYSRLEVSDPRRILNAFIIGCVIGSFAAGFTAIFTHITAPYLRVEGFAGNIGPFATICAALYCVNFLSLIYVKNFRARVLVAIGTLLVVYALLRTGMRTVWPIIILVPLITLLLHPLKWKIPGPKKLIALAVLGLFVCFAGYQGYQQRIQPLVVEVQENGLNANGETSLGQRLTIWRCAIRNIGTSPLTGIGISDTRNGINHCTNQLVNAEFNYTHVHNAPMNAWLEGGIFELFALMSVLFMPLLADLKTARTRNPVSNMGLGIVVTIVALFTLQGATNLLFGHDIHDHLFIYFVACGLFVSTASKAPDVMNSAHLRN